MNCDSVSGKAALFLSVPIRYKLAGVKTSRRTLSEAPADFGNDLRKRFLVTADLSSGFRKRSLPPADFGSDLRQHSLAPADSGRSFRTCFLVGAGLAGASARFRRSSQFPRGRSLRLWWKLSRGDDF
jgi:hypothetical protein